MRPPAATVPFGPLWFLAVYAVVVIAAPAMIRLHDRFGVAVPGAMFLGTVACDALGFVGGMPGFRYPNIIFVLFLPHQLRFFYAEGRMQPLPRRTHWALALGGLGALILLTNPWLFGEAGDRWFQGVGHYPRGLLGSEVEPISNAYPPTLAYMAMGFWSIGAVMLLRERLSRWLERPRAWMGVILVNSVIMTLFLWHMTAYLLAVLVLWPLGFGRTDATSIAWWVERPLWVIVPGAFLVALTAVFGRFERPAALRRPSVEPPAAPAASASRMTSS